MTPDDVVALAHRRSRPVLAPTVEERMAPARRIVEEAVAGDDIVYGITTGFGALVDDPGESRRGSRVAGQSLQEPCRRGRASGCPMNW